MKDIKLSPHRLNVEDMNSLKSTPVKSRWNPESYKSHNSTQDEIRRELQDVRQFRPTAFEKVNKENMSMVNKRALEMIFAITDCPAKIIVCRCSKQSYS